MKKAIVVIGLLAVVALVVGANVDGTAKPISQIPITQALMKLGMHKGPVLALLLAGPALSLPNILVIRKVIGNSKTIVFIILVVVMSTIVGMLFGAFWG